MTKRFCDCCKKEVKTQFVYLTVASDNFIFGKITNKTYELCSECATKIRTMIEEDKEDERE